MSEASFLVKQLEYCINCKYKDSAKLIVSELIKFNTKVKISYKYKYTCSSHENLYKNAFTATDHHLFHYFNECKHLVCYECLRKYIYDIFNKIGIIYDYACPGCNAEFSLKKTRLNFREPYFTNVISESQIKKSLEDYDLTLALTFNRIKSELKKTKCYFFDHPEYNIKCFDQGRLQRIPNCKHPICDYCFRKRLEVLKDENEFYCPIPECKELLPHEIIEEILIQGESLTNELWPKLKIEGVSLIICLICKKLLKSTDCSTLILCRCGYELCPRCGHCSHPGISCFVIKSDVKAYKEFECTAHDEIIELREHYFFALSKFEWDMHKKNVGYLRNVYHTNLQLKKVNYIFNPILQQKYNKAKEFLIKIGTYEGEIYVFHATSNNYYTSICKNGFKIGGVDVDIKIGNTYGYGIYTGTDAAMSIYYYGKDNNKMLICKALLGKRGDHPIGELNEFVNTEDNYFFVDFQGKQTNYYVFFKKDQVLPYYIVEYS